MKSALRKKSLKYKTVVLFFGGLNVGVYSRKNKIGQEGGRGGI